jgi:hypothetical protein
MVREHESLLAIRAFEMPEWRLSLRRRQILEGTRVAQWEQKTAQNELSSVQAHWFDRCRDFDISCDVFASSVHRSEHIVELTTLRRGELRRWIVERFDTRFDI